MAKTEFVEELNKLKKSELIDIIISKKVPEGVKLNENIRLAIFNNENCETLMPSLLETADKVRLTNLEIDLKCSHIELEYVKQLNAELKRTVNNLETIIELLKNGNPKILPNNESNRSVVANITKSSNLEIFKGSAKPPTPSSSISSKETSAAILSAQTKTKMNEVIHLENDNVAKANRPQKIIGSDSSDGDVSAGAKAWLFVTKYNMSYTAEQLEESLKKKFKNKSFTCVQLKNNWNFNSFKVAVDPDIKDVLLDGKMWPNGIEVSEYFFRRSASVGRRQHYNHRRGYANQRMPHTRRH